MGVSGTLSTSEVNLGRPRAVSVDLSGSLFVGDKANLHPLTSDYPYLWVYLSINDD